jgi:hypothetical protein
MGLFSGVGPFHLDTGILAQFEVGCNGGLLQFFFCLLGDIDREKPFIPGFSPEGNDLP